MDKCPACGKEVSAGSPFCNHCGANMKADPKAVMLAAHTKEVEEARKMATETERKRVADILAKCNQYKLEADFAKTMIDDPTCTPEMASDKILQKITAQAPAGVKPGVTMGADESEKYRMLAPLALAQQGGIPLSKEDESKVAAMTDRPSGLHGLIRMALIHEGLYSHNKVLNMSATDLADHANRLAYKMETSSELTSILADVANKSLLRGANLAAVTYSLWTSSVEAKDFKALNLDSLSEFSDIDLLPEGFDMKRGRLSDKSESVSLDTYAKLLVLTRKAIINDDLGALTRGPAAIMNAVERKKNMVCYDKLTAASLVGPTMKEDNTPLFDATHGNLLTSTGIPTIAKIGANDVAMREMPLLKPDAKSATQYSGNSPKYLVTGVNNMIAIRQLLGAQYDIGTANSAVTQAPNPYTGIVPIFDPYLQSLLTAASAANAWYTFTDPTIAPHFVVSYLAGQRVPTLRSMPSQVGQALGISWDVFIEFAIGVADWRHGIYNDGK